MQQVNTKFKRLSCEVVKRVTQTRADWLPIQRQSYSCRTISALTDDH